MNIFATLPADARKSLARKEMRRRGLGVQRTGQWTDLLSYHPTEDLKRMEALCTRWSATPVEEPPLDVKSEFRAILANVVRTIRQADIADRGSSDAECLQLAQRLEAKFCTPSS